MVWCCVAGCSNSTQKDCKPQDVGFHRFPDREKAPALFQTWVRQLGKDDHLPGRSARVCSMHFKIDDYELSSILKQQLMPNVKSLKFLKADAVPSLNLSNSPPVKRRSTRQCQAAKRLRSSDSEPHEPHEVDKDSSQVSGQDAATPSLGLRRKNLLGEVNEKRLATHIHLLSVAVGPPDKHKVRKMAYEYAEQFGIRNFPKDGKMAREDWLQSFLERYPPGTVKVSESLMDKARSIAGYYRFLREVLQTWNVRPWRMFMMAASPVPMPNDVGGDRTMTVIACHSPQEGFLPPVLVLDGADEPRNLPFGSFVFRDSKPSRMTPNLFTKWFKEYFLPKKPPGKTVVIVQGDAPPQELQELAERRGVMLTTAAPDAHLFLPLKQTFFRIFKEHLRRQAQIRAGKNLGSVMKRAWEFATKEAQASLGFGDSALRPTDFYPMFNHLFDIVLSESGERPDNMGCQAELGPEVRGPEGEKGESVQGQHESDRASAGEPIQAIVEVDEPGNDCNEEEMKEKEVQQELQRFPHDDVDLMFFKSLIPDLKSLPASRRMHLKLQLYKILCKEVAEVAEVAG